MMAYGCGLTYCVRVYGGVINKAWASSGRYEILLFEVLMYSDLNVHVFNCWYCRWVVSWKIGSFGLIVKRGYIAWVGPVTMGGLLNSSKVRVRGEAVWVVHSFADLLLSVIFSGLKEEMADCQREYSIFARSIIFDL